jgi:antitoxin component of MazEF toxin-antitoxin module
MAPKSKIKRWGNSLGVVLPKAYVEEEGLREGEVVEVTVKKVSDVRSIRGKYPFKNLQHEKDEMRRGWASDAET